MGDVQELVFEAMIIGAGATVVMDIWALLLKRFFNIPSLNYAMVGRWIGHFPQGTFMHENIVRAHPVRGEKLIGWGAHYGIGIVFAGVLLLLWGLEWAQRPTLFPALFIGIVTVVAPFFLMQPSFGFGIAASKTPQPNRARVLSLAAHSIYGLGLYLSALFWSEMF